MKSYSILKIIICLKLIFDAQKFGPFHDILTNGLLWQLNNRHFIKQQKRECKTPTVDKEMHCTRISVLVLIVFIT